MGLIPNTRSHSLTHAWLSTLFGFLCPLLTSSLGLATSNPETFSMVGYFLAVLLELNAIRIFRARRNAAGAGAGVVVSLIIGIGMFLVGITIVLVSVTVIKPVTIPY